MDAAVCESHPELVAAGHVWRLPVEDELVRGEVIAQARFKNAALPVPGSPTAGRGIDPDGDPAIGVVEKVALQISNHQRLS